MANIADIQAALANQTPVIQRATAQLATLSADLKAALATSDPQAIQQIVDTLDANTKALGDQVAASAPPAAAGTAPPAP